MKREPTVTPENGLRYRGERVPPAVATLFWDFPNRALELEEHTALLVRRTLNEGSWEACRWLRERLGDEAIERHLSEARGRGIDRRSLRLWQVLLDLPPEEVDDWLRDPARRIWDRRVS